MTPPAAFIDSLARSRLLPPDHVERLAGRFSWETARGAADALIRAGDLTHYQAEKLLRGQWQGLAVGPYRILAPLGRGGMGTVYLARDVRLAEELGDEVLVALKILPPRSARADPRMLLRFSREVELGKRAAGHPNVASTFGGGEADGVHFLAMEFVPGKTVRQIVDGGTPLTVGEAARVFADVAAGLAHVHDRGLVHRDIKPANVMLTPDGRTKVLDFGLSYSPGEPAADPSVLGGRGHILGTMDYIAPEQARNSADVGPRADLYSLGCSLYFALTGSPPFPGGTSKEKIRRQRSEEPAPLTGLNPSVPAAFARVVGTLMAKSPARRPASAGAARDLLLPFASPPVPRTALTVRDVLGVVDSPDAHPELWGDEAGHAGDDGVPDPGPELLPLPDDEPPDPPTPTAPAPLTPAPWVLPAVVAGAVAALLVLLTILRRV